MPEQSGRQSSLIILKNNGLNLLPWNFFVSKSYCKLGYITGMFRALQLIVLVVFGAVD